jgi:hypothetical protein
MRIDSDKDFQELRKHFSVWRKRFPMFTHDVNQIEHMIENRIQHHSIIMVQHRQTKSRACLEKAQQEIDAINQILNTVEKIELMAIIAKA